MHAAQGRGGGPAAARSCSYYTDGDDADAVGAPPEPANPTPPASPIATRRPTRAAANRPASVWQDDAYRITGRAA